ncbi:heavy metal translocating P-type ATPase [Corynebacterium hansenii]|uniref:Heavy metal translocating P-type ATPase n=1 Tax=Corynebacterium hansenii TaxID=394964 RepID=A0ABV7ZPA8_9CORY|nr:cation-translocating P-type ATPase [Corynebacterium hansenii]WJZ00549.1 Zinc-transporting ATPase [Corynebacterium hansenii]
MTSACGCSHDAPEPLDFSEPEAPPTPWWRDREVLVPVFSGVALVAAFAIGHADPTAGIAPLALYWAALLLGASTFVPGALTGLVRHRRAGIGLLMTISAVGAVALGYVAEAAALAFLYSISEALEDKAMDRARRGLRSLLSLIPDTATVVDPGCGSRRTIPARRVRPGMRLAVPAGGRVPTDSVLDDAHATIDSSSVTGESIPVELAAGDAVMAGVIAVGSPISVTATAPGDDNSLTAVVALVENAQAEKGRRARIADRIARPLVPGVLVLAAAVAILGAAFGDPLEWITRALVVLVAASPCALAISVPVTVISAIGAASRFGVVVKSGAAFERLGAVGHVAIDKTGTLTRNEPTVTEVAVSAAAVDGGYGASDVLGWAAALERHSSHPLAAAIIAGAAARDAGAAARTTIPDAGSIVGATAEDPALPAAVDVAERPGIGLTGTVGGAAIAVGNPRSLDPGDLGDDVARLEAEGNTVVIVHRDGAPVGAIAVRDELRPEAAGAIAALKRAGIGVTMLTGDNRRAARALAAAAGIDDVRAELAPRDKSDAVAELGGSDRPHRRGRRGGVAMIGDGINDAPALASADVGIAMGATGSDAAVESADVAFTGHDLRLLPQALAHARRGRRIMEQNIGLSLLIIGGLLPLALTGVLGLAAVVLIHEVAEVVVILNGLRAARAKTVPQGL